MASADIPAQSAKSKATLAYFLSISILGTFTALGGPALPSLAANTSSTLDQISLCFVMGSLGYLLGSLLGGRAYDRFPGNRLLALTLLGVAASGALIPTAHKLWWLLSIQLVLGLAQGANDVGCNTLLLWTHGRKSGPYVNGLHFSFGVGTSIAPLALAGILSINSGFQWAFWIFALLCLPLAVWIWRLPEGSQLEGRGATASKSAVLFPAVLLVLAFLFYVGAEVGFGGWVYTYALTREMGTTITAAYLTSAFWGTFTVGRLLGVWISSRYQPIPVLIADLLGCLASLSLIALWPDSIAALWIGSVSCGLFMASVFPTMLLLAGERLDISGRVTSWFLVGGGAGSMILPWIIGQAFTRIGSSALPFIVLFAILLNLIFVMAFSSQTGRSLE
jgi:FHS family Na+ dependent glucose MFS transporter 1